MLILDRVSQMDDQLVLHVSNDESLDYNMLDYTDSEMELDNTKPLIPEVVVGRKFVPKNRITAPTTKHTKTLYSGSVTKRSLSASTSRTPAQMRLGYKHRLPTNHNKRWTPHHSTTTKMTNTNPSMTYTTHATHTTHAAHNTHTTPYTNTTPYTHTTHTAKRTLLPTPSMPAPPILFSCPPPPIKKWLN